LGGGLLLNEGRIYRTPAPEMVATIVTDGFCFCAPITKKEGVPRRVPRAEGRLEAMTVTLHTSHSHTVFSKTKNNELGSTQDEFLQQR
jgi:adenine/guanine phosphoribosyltransferase-like PRPP-binding protein